MIFQIYRPISWLNQFVEHLVYFEGLSAAHNLDRFLPDGNTELLIELNDSPQYIYDNETLEKIQTCRQAWVSGVRTRPITIPSGNGSRMLVVAFSKGKAFPFYRFPMSDLTDLVVDADLIFGSTVLQLREQLLCAKSIDQMFHLVERFLMQQARDAIIEDASARCVDFAVASILHSPTFHRFHQLSHEIGYSQKHFISLFKEKVGISPKQYLKIIRFQKTIHAIEKQDTLRWNDIALNSGFYDQAHFIHDFKLFSGFTPREYMKRRASLLNYIPVD